MAEFIYTMYKARKAHGDKVILDDVTMSFYPGAKIGVVGPNGAGKSTILKIMAGIEQPSNGEARLSPGYSVGILLQEPPLNEDKDVIGNVREGVGEIYAKLERFNEISEEMANPDADYDTLLAEMGKLQDELDHADAWDLDSQLEQAMDALRCPPPDADVKVLSGGERRRVALCKLLLEKPDLLLLDEPTNHLDAESVLWLEQHLAKYPGAVLAVTHDRYFLDHVAQWICEVDRGRLYPYEGNYSTYLETKAARLADAGQEGPEARRSASRRSSSGCARTPRVARPSRRRASTATKRWRQRRRRRASSTSRRSRSRRARALAPSCSRRRTSRRASATALLIDGLSFSLPAQRHRRRHRPQRRRQDHAVQDHRWPRAARRRETSRSARPSSCPTWTRAAAASTPTKSLWEVVSDGLDYIKVGAVEMPSRAYVGAFGFKGPDQQKAAGILSGGERNRLNLALTLKEGGNVLLLDEPTNDLDVETLGSLENALLEFPGCAVVVSHDRWFLDRVATHILAYEGTEDEPRQLVLVRGQLRLLRGEQGRAARARRRSSPPRHVPQAHEELAVRAGRMRAIAVAVAGRVSNDPFNPDVTIWPEAPGWLFPTVMVALAVVVQSW